MGFEFRINGLEELERKIDEMQKGLTLPYLEFWCERISSDVKLNSTEELGERFTLEVFLGEDENPQFKFNSPPELVQLVIDSIKNYLNDMPITTKALFETLLNVIEKEWNEQQRE